MPKQIIKTREEVLSEFSKKGLTIRQWARDKGFHYRTVYNVLHGSNKGNFGQAHGVAVLLGLKEGEI